MLPYTRLKAPNPTGIFSYDLQNHRARSSSALSWPPWSWSPSRPRSSPRPCRRSSPQLGGLRLYSWVFSSFLLTQTAMTVVFGKLSDLYGRKPIMLLGIAIFLVGSILAGFAWSMPSMVVFRLIQGIGAGAVQPVA